MSEPKTMAAVFGNTAPDETRICDEHGEYQSRNYLGNHWSNCPVCTDKEKEEREKQELEEEQRKKRERLEMRWRAKIGVAAIPDRFKDRSLDSYKAETPAQEKALNFAREYAEGFDQVLETGRCAIFVGKPGTGKTHLAVGIALHILKQERSALFVTVQRLIRRVKDSWNRANEETESQVISLFTEPQLLILDEVGVQFGSDFERQVLFDVLNERYERRRPTILLSNIPGNELGQYLGERVTDRLREDGGKMIAFDWESWRSKR